jgi:hypothetical protein
MSINTITRILDQHGIPYMIQNNQVLADSMVAFTPLFSETINVTNYTRAQLLEWLGY